MASIDDRIVNMKFNNSQFQHGIAQTNSSLEQLSSTLKLTDATSGIDQVQSAANRFSLENMQSALDKISNRFGVFGVVGFTVIQNLTNSALNAGKSIAASLIEPLVHGGGKRALALQQAKFQFRGLGLDIKSTMAAALSAVKGTAFGLDDAATAAASFGATGITAGNGLASVLRSVAGVAAQTGSSYSQVANIFQTIAGNGRLMGDQLNQLASYGVNAAAILAKSLGTTESNVRKMVSDGKISFQTFSDAMNVAFGANAAKANETYTGALANMHAALARIGADVASPYFFGMRDIFNALGPMFDNINTSLEPVLTQFGDLFGLFSGDAVKSINSLNFDNLLILSKGVADAMKNVFHLLKLIGVLIGQAFREIFPPATASQFKSIADFLRQFTAALIPTSKTANELRRSFAGVFAIFSILGQIIGSVIKTFFDLIGVVSPVGGSFLQITAKIGDFLVKIDEFLKKGRLIQTFFHTLGQLIAIPIAVLQTFFGIIADGVQDLGLFNTKGLDDFADDVHDRFSGLINLGNFFMTVMKTLVGVVKAVYNFLKPVFDAIGNAVSTAVGNVMNSLKGLSFQNALQVINTGIFAGFLLVVRGFFGNLGGIIRGNGVAFITHFKIIMNSLRTNLKALEINTNAKTLTQIAIAVALLAASAIGLSLVNSGKLTIALAAIGGLMGSLIGAFALFGKVGGTKGVVQAAALSLALTGIATAILILSASVAILGALPLANLVQGTLALAAVIGVLSGALVLLGKAGPSVLISASAIGIMAPALALLAGVIAILGFLPFDKLLQGGTALAVVLTVLAGALALLSRIGPQVLIAVISINLFVPSILLLTGAVAALAALPLNKLIKGITGFLVILAALVGAILLLGFVGPKALIGAVAIAAVALSLVPLVGAIALLGSLPLPNLIQGMVAFTAALAILVGAVLLLGFTGPVALIGAAAIVAIALAIAVLAPALLILSSISWAGIGRLLTILSAGLGILAVMGVLLIPASVGFLLFGTAILLIGTGVSLAATGISLLAAAIVILVSVGAAGIGLFTAGITAFIRQLPALGVGIGEAFVSMVVTIGENAPKLIAAFVKLILAMLAAIKQVVPELINTAVVIIVTLIKALVVLIPLLVDAGLKIITGILKGIADNIGDITTQAINIITNFINALADNIGKIIDAGANLIVKFLKGLSDGIKNHSSEFTRQGSRLFRAIVDAVSKAIAQGGKDLRYAGKKIGNALLEGARNALGIHSPSRKFRDEIMPSVFAGIEEGNDKHISRAEDAGSAIGDAVGTSAVTAMKDSLSQLSDAMGLANIDTSPTIKPILDLSDIQNKALQVPGILKTPTLSLDTSNAVAQSVSLQDQNRNAQILLDASKTDKSSKGDITYIQNNNSPKALSTVELYRQTRNQLSTLKEDLDVVDKGGSS